MPAMAEAPAATAIGQLAYSDLQGESSPNRDGRRPAIGQMPAHNREWLVEIVIED